MTTLPNIRLLPPDALVAGPVAARLLGCSRMQLWRLTRAGALPAPIKMTPTRGGRTFWAAGDLVAFLDALRAARQGGA